MWATSLEYLKGVSPDSPSDETEQPALVAAHFLS